MYRTDRKGTSQKSVEVARYDDGQQRRQKQNDSKYILEVVFAAGLDVWGERKERFKDESQI